MVSLALAIAIVIPDTSVSLKSTLIGLALAQPAIAAALLLQALRHKIAIHDDRLSFRLALESVLLSTGFNLLAPARLSEVLKATYLREQAHIPINVALSAIAVERLTDVAVVLAMAPFVPALLFVGGIETAAAVLGLAMLVGLMRNKIIKLLSRSPSNRLREFLLGSLEAFGERIMSGRFILGAMISGAALVLSLVAVHVYLAIASPIGLGWRETLAVFIAGIAGGSAALLPGAIGSFHAAVTLALVGLGIDISSAFALSVGLHLLQYVLTLPAAMVIVLMRNLGFVETLTKARALFAARRNATRKGNA